jgi:hypothetical protein
MFPTDPGCYTGRGVSITAHNDRWTRRCSSRATDTTAAFLSVSSPSLGYGIWIYAAASAARMMSENLARLPRQRPHGVSGFRLISSL